MSHRAATRAGFARTWPMAIVLLGMVFAPPQAAYAQVDPTVVESGGDAAVRSLWSTLDSLWNARDADRLSRLFTDDASFRFVDRGQSLESRASIQQHFTKQFSQQAPELRHRTRVRESRNVAPNIVAVDGDVEVLRTGSEESLPPAVLRRFAIFAVMQKSAAGWQIRLLRVFQLPAATTTKESGA
jgi:uncharacterized protein (TIGR02246 family)